VGRETAANDSHETNSCDIDLVTKPLRHAQAEGRRTICTHPRKIQPCKENSKLLPHKQTLGLGWVNPETRKVKRRLKGNALQV